VGLRSLMKDRYGIGSLGLYLPFFVDSHAVVCKECHRHVENRFLLSFITPDVTYRVQSTIKFVLTLALSTALFPRGIEALESGLIAYPLVK
jgi:hypothetical protein